MTRDDERLANLLRTLHDPWAVSSPPEWTVANPTGYLVGVISRDSYSPSGWRLTGTMRATTVERLADAGLVAVGGEGVVPEYDGGRRGWRWEEGRVGRRLVVTALGSAVLVFSSAV